MSFSGHQSVIKRSDILFEVIEVGGVLCNN